MGTALVMPCPHLEEWTDGDDVRRRSVFFGVARSLVTFTLSLTPCSPLAAAARARADSRDARVGMGHGHGPQRGGGAVHRTNLLWNSYSLLYCHVPRNAKVQR